MNDADHMDEKKSEVRKAAEALIDECFELSTSNEEYRDLLEVASRRIRTAKYNNVLASGAGP